MSTEVQTYPQSQQHTPRYSPSTLGSSVIATMPAVVQTENPAPPRNETIARSMSRYRGNRRVKTQADPPPMPTNPLYKRPHAEPQSSSGPYNEPDLDLEAIPRRREDSSQGKTVEDAPRHVLAGATTASSQSRGIRSLPEGQRDLSNLVQTSAPTAGVHPRNFSENAARPEARYAVNGDDSCQAQILCKEQTDGRRMKGAGYDDRRREELERTYGHRQRRQSLRQGAQPINQPAIKSEDLGFLSREHKQRQPTSRPILSTKKSFTQRMAGSISKATGSDSRAELKRTISFPIPIEPESVAPAPVPSFDAPISAVNAGERRVMVKCQDSVIPITITPSTTPVDVIRFASSKMPGIIDPNSVVLLESFKQVGLERPLRRYEHIRNVLNSWDNDEQNVLIVVPSPTGGNDDDLDLRSVSREQPGDTSVYLYHSQMPGKWDKRWITLRSDGQVVLAKNLVGETTNICHLSDFDIYAPTPRQMAKKIKPPKKVCFAVKSQQKSSMFMSTANFVHFFSTSDRKLATSWYKAVQEWRSWYLVNVMGEGQKKVANAHTANSIHRRNSIKAPAAANSVQHTNGSHHGLPFAPAPTMGAVGPAQSNQIRVKAVRDRGAPPVSFPKRLTKDALTGEATTRKHGPTLIQSHAEQAQEPEPFEPASLLGRTYSQRQKAVQTQPNHCPITVDYPNSGNSPATGSNAINELKRSSSQRQKPRPLIDLTPKYIEPPQHSRKGRGIIPKQLPPGGLVDIATSPETAIPIPPTTSWRRPREGSPATQRTHTLRGTRPSHLSNPESPHTSPERAAYNSNDDIPAFTGAGLLAKTGKSQGGTCTGRGVMSGDRQAKGPMIDVVEPSQFVQGSLLAGMGVGEKGVVVDREKWRTVDVLVGEGV
jgi:hypothetical protein